MALRLSQLDNLYQRARTIRDEVMRNANTALRVGSLLYDIITALSSVSLEELRGIFLVKDGDDATSHKLTMGEAEVTGNAAVDGNLAVGGDVNISGDNKIAGSTETKSLRVKGEQGVPESEFINASTHLRTVVFGDYMPAAVGAANGALIKENGEAQFKSVTVSGSLTVPEIRFNRGNVYLGIGLRSSGGGIIEDVIQTSATEGRASLKLEKGEYGAIDIGDKCLGFYHNVGWPYEGESNSEVDRDDHNGNYELKGFQSVYFKVIGFYATKDDYIDGTNLITDTASPRGSNKYFAYELRPVDEDWNIQRHPHVEMHFGQIANDVNTDRQNLVVTTTKYELMLTGLTDWTYSSANIVDIRGKLDGFSMRAVDPYGQPYTQIFEGTGSVLGNVYLFGKINMFGRDDRVDLLAKTLRVEFYSSRGSTVYVDDVDTILEAHLMYGEIDVTADALAEAGVVVSWSRDSNNPAEDGAWTPTVVDDEGNIVAPSSDGYSASRHRIRLLQGEGKVRQDLGSNWERQLWSKFRINFNIPQGDVSLSIPGEISINS